MKNLIKKIPFNIKLTFDCILVVLIVALLYYPLIPTLLNYPPDSVNTAFQIKVNYFHYTTQYIAIVCLVVLALSIVFPFVFRKTNKFDKIDSLDMKNNAEEIIPVVKFCFNFPIVILLAFLIIPPLIIFIGLLLL